MLSVYPSIGRDWNHELAVFRRPAAQGKPPGGLPRSLWNHLMAATARLEASVGRHGRKLLRLMFTHGVINGHEPAVAPRSEASRNKPRIARLFTWGAPQPLPSSSWRLMAGK